MQITNQTKLPEAIVQAIQNDAYDPGQCDISVTALIGPPRIRQLKQQFSGQIVEDAADRIWSLVGQAVHTILERAEQSAITETRLYAEVDGWRIGGQFDRMVVDGGDLSDYKVTSVWSVIHGHKPEWEQQLNMLRYLAQKNGYTVDNLYVHAILRDWSKGKAKQGGDYPPQQVVTLPVPVWDLEYAHQFIAERVQLHRAAALSLPDCTPAERWERPTKYAVMKDGNIKATKVWDTRDEAEAYIAGHPARDKMRVDVRPGESVRCADYCEVSQFCEQFQRGNDGL